MADAEPVSSRSTRDEIDPELISLKKRRPGVGPVLAACVIILTGYAMVKLRHDLGFAFAEDTPRELGPVAALYQKGEAPPDNAYVTLQATPDASRPGWLRGRQAVGHRLVPVLGTSRRLWLQVTDETVHTHPGLTFTGRIRPLEQLAFLEGLTDYVAALPPEPRWLDPASLADPRTDVHGDALTVTPDAPVAIDQRVAGVAIVSVYKNDQVKDEAGARAALTAAGLPPAPELVRSSETSFTFEVPAPEGLAGVRTAIAKAQLWAATASDSVSEKVIRWNGVWRDVKVEGGQIALASGARFPVAEVAAVLVRVPAHLPADARVLAEGEVPADYWYLFPLYAVLALLFGLMVWALVRAVRGDEPPPALPISFAPPPTPDASS